MLVLVFAMPVISAFLWRPTGTINQGELIKPPRAITNHSLFKTTGEPFSFSELQGDWSLVYIGGQQCSELCDNELYRMNRVRLTQGKAAYRVRSLYIMPRSVTVDEISQRLKAHVGVSVLQAESATMKSLTKEFSVDDAQAVEQQHRIYIVDPQGNLMMHYHADFDPAGIRRDLKRLLKVSQVG